MLLHLYFALDKQSLSAICLQREPGLAGVEGCVSQDSCAVLQHLQIACALQCGKMLFIDGNTVLSQLTEQLPAAHTGAQLVHKRRSLSMPLPVQHQK